MSLKLALTLAAAIFALTVLARLPAGVVPWLLPAAVHCDSPEGTIWDGSCGTLRSGAVELGDLRWTLRPAALLRARLVADLRSADPRAAGQTRLTLHSDGLIEFEQLDAQLPLQGGLRVFPPDWSGELELALDRASLWQGHLRTLQGRITLRQLSSEHPPAELGSFELDVPAPAETAGADAAIVGQLHDIGGPLSLQAQVRLSGQGAYELNGSVATRGDAGSELQRALQLLGPPDAQGRYPLSLSGTL